MEALHYKKFQSNPYNNRIQSKTNGQIIKENEKGNPTYSNVRSIMNTFTKITFMFLTIADDFFS